MTVITSEIQGEEKRLLAYLTANVATMRQASKALQMDRANICRYVDHLRTIGKVKVVKVAHDETSGHLAMFLTAPTNCTPC